MELFYEIEKEDDETLNTWVRRIHDNYQKVPTFSQQLFGFGCGVDRVYSSRLVAGAQVKNSSFVVFAETSAAPLQPPYRALSLTI